MSNIKTLNIEKYDLFVMFACGFLTCQAITLFAMQNWFALPVAIGAIGLGILVRRNIKNLNGQW